MKAAIKDWLLNPLKEIFKIDKPLSWKEKNDISCLICEKIKQHLGHPYLGTYSKSLVGKPNEPQQKLHHLLLWNKNRQIGFSTKVFFSENNEQDKDSEFIFVQYCLLGRDGSALCIRHNSYYYKNELELFIYKLLNKIDKTNNMPLYKKYVYPIV